MKKLQYGLIVFGMMAIGQINAQSEEKPPRKIEPTTRPTPKPKPTTKPLPKPEPTTKPLPTTRPAPESEAKVDKQFAKLDKNGDGFLVLAEMQNGKGEEAKDQVKRFQKMDVNNDNRVTLAEFRAHKAKKAKKEHKGKKEHEEHDHDHGDKKGGKH